MAALLILNMTTCYFGILARSHSRGVRSIVATRLSIRLTTSRRLKSVVNRDSISDRNTVGVVREAYHGSNSANWSSVIPFLRPAWAALEKHYHKIKDVHLRQLFAEDRERGERLAIEAAGIYLDYSKNRITHDTRRTAPCFTSPCARRGAPRSCMTAAMSCSCVRIDIRTRR
jgi:hypothetical protein